MLQDIRDLKQRIYNRPYQAPQYVLTTVDNEIACKLLELPAGTELSSEQVERALDIAFERMTPQQQSRVLAILWSRAI